MPDSIFTKIIKGEIPCYKVHEDGRTLAFLDIHPAQPGHTLVVPKAQIDKLYDLDEADYQAVMAAVQKVAVRIQAVLQPRRVGLHVEGFDVPHAHVHVIPINRGFADFAPPDKDSGPGPAALAEMAAKLSF